MRLTKDCLWVRRFLILVIKSQKKSLVIIYHVIALMRTLSQAFFGHMKLGKIMSEDINDFLDILEFGGKIGDLQIKKQSGTSMLKQYCVLNEIFKEYLKRKNPCTDARTPKKRKGSYYFIGRNPKGE